MTVVGRGWLLQTEDPGIGAELSMNCWATMSAVAASPLCRSRAAPLLQDLMCQGLKSRQSSGCHEPMRRERTGYKKQQMMARRDANHRATREGKRTMPDETTFELASVQFGAEPVAVFRFGYERFELRARLGPGNLEHAIAEAAEVAASVLRDGRTKRWPSHSGFALARTEGQCITRPRITNDCLRGVLPVGTRPGEGLFFEPTAVARPWARETRHQSTSFC